MKDAIGGSLLLNLVVIFTSVVILFFAGILAYSKAYKVKNKIIEIIESHDGKIVDIDKMSEDVLEEINTELKNVGYMISEAPSNDSCSRDSSRGDCVNLNNTNFKYCVCAHDSAISNGQSYEVITYVHFSFPIIGDLLSIPVKGETKILDRSYDY